MSAQQFYRPGDSVPETGVYSAIKVFEISTGLVSDEIKYAKLAPSGNLWVSNTGSGFVLTNSWVSKFKRRFTEENSSNSSLLFFKYHENYPSCALGPLPEKKSKMEQAGFIRFSSDLTVVGLSANGKITLH